MVEPWKKLVLVKEGVFFWENSLSLVLFLQLSALECKQGLGAFYGCDAHRVLRLSRGRAEEVGTV